MKVNPRAAGFSPERLANVDGLLRARYLEPGRLPNAVTLIERKGEIAHFSTQGYADVAAGKRVEQETIFRIYSMTKPITALVFMMMVEEGAFALEDPVDRHIPEWADLGVYEGGTLGAFQTSTPERPMQIIDLLRHTSGLTYGFQQRTNVDAAYRALNLGMPDLYGTLEEMIAQLADLPLEFSPGKAWNYSVATDVLGYLIQQKAGKDLGTVFEERLFAPLGMTDTAFFVPDHKLSRFCACYQALPHDRMALKEGIEDSVYRVLPEFYSGGGGLVSTATDFLKLCRMLMQGGQANGKRYLSRKTLELMTANHLPGGRTLYDMSVSLFSEATFAGIGFGLGVAVTQDPAQSMVPGSAGEFFWGGMANTAFWVDPREELIVVFMTQLMPSTLYPIRRELRTLIYSAIDD